MMAGEETKPLRWDVCGGRGDLAPTIGCVAGGETVYDGGRGDQAPTMGCVWRVGRPSPYNRSKLFLCQKLYTPFTTIEVNVWYKMIDML